MIARADQDDHNRSALHAQQIAVQGLEWRDFPAPVLEPSLDGPLGLSLTRSCLASRLSDGPAAGVQSWVQGESQDEN